MVNLWFLKSCQVFERLPESEINWLGARSHHRVFAARSVIYLPLHQGDSVVTLTSGRVKLCHAGPEGKEVILAFIDPGELFGELSLFEPAEREELAIAVEKSSVVLIPRELMQQSMSRYPDLAMGISRLIGLRRQRLERRLKSLLFQPNRDRLIHLLLELLDKYGRKTAEGMLIDIKLSHQDLASIIGSTRETVSATLGELQSEGLVKLGRQRIVVTSPAALADLVKQTCIVARTSGRSSLDSAEV